MKCKKCNYEWMARVPEDQVKCCPGCKTRNFRERINVADCKRCGYEWITQIPTHKIKQCPSCHTRLFRLARPATKQG